MTEKTLGDLGAEWKAAIAVERDTEAKALVAGRRLRVHVGHLLSALWKTALAVVHGHELAAGNPLAVAKVTAELFGAGLAAFRAVQETLSEAEFLACVTLSDLPEGLTQEELEEGIRFRCTEVPLALFPWYLGIDERYLEQARRGLKSPNTIADVVAALKTKGLVRTAENGRLLFIDRELVWELL